MPLARRKTSFTQDGAEFQIAPLTYDEYEIYLEQQKELASLNLSDDNFPEEARQKSRRLTFFVVCCGLNNAVSQIIEAQDKLARDKLSEDEYNVVVKEHGTTEAVLLKEMDDFLAAKMW